MGLVYCISAAVVGALFIALQCLVLVVIAVLVWVMGNLLMYPWNRRMALDCVPILESWAEENDLTLLRSRYFGISGITGHFASLQIVFRVAVVDTYGTRKGWVRLTGRCIEERFYYTRIDSRPGCPGAVSGPRFAALNPLNQPLWDDELDGGWKPLTRNLDW